MSETEGEHQDSSLFTQHGKASLLEQYVDITDLRFQTRNAKNNLRKYLRFNYTGLDRYLADFYLYFGNLYDATCFEVANTKSKGADKNKILMDDEFKKRVDKFFNTNIDITDRDEVIEMSEEGLKLHDIYEEYLGHSGFRKVSFFSLNEDELWRKNF